MRLPGRGAVFGPLTRALRRSMHISNVQRPPIWRCAARARSSRPTRREDAFGWTYHRLTAEPNAQHLCFGLRLSVTAEEYGRLLIRLRNEVETASAAFYTAKEINRFALESVANFEKLNRDAQFWNLQVHALQTVYVTGLGRLFDKRRDVHSIMELLEATETNPGHFSKAALRERKRRTSGVQDWEVIERYLDGVWEPRRDEVRQFRKELEPSLRIYRARYETIRHGIFAHIGKDQRVIADAISKALLAEIDMMFLDLLEVMDALQALFDNGVKHERRVGPHRYAREVQRRTRDVLSRL